MAWRAGSLCFVLLRLLYVFSCLLWIVVFCVVSVVVFGVLWCVCVVCVGVYCCGVYLW